MKGALFAGLSCFAAACEPLPAPAEERRLPGDGPLRLEQIYAVRGPLGEVEVGGLDGAGSPGAHVGVVGSGGSPLADAIIDAHGRFTLALGAYSETTVAVGLLDRELTTFRVRDADPARVAAVRAPIGGAGSVPNDLMITGAPENPRVVLVRSGDNAVSSVDLALGLEGASSGVRLPAIDGAAGALPANPWFAVALDGTGRRIAVTAYGQSRVYLVDLEQGSIEQILEMTQEVTLPAPFSLARPFDLDRDGAAESQIDRFVPRSPQGLASDGDHLYVGFSGFVAPRTRDGPPVFVPAVLATWDLHDQSPARLTLLPALDPQELRLTASHELVITCSGAVDLVGGAPISTTPGAVLIYDPGTAQLIEHRDLASFAPSSTVVFEDRLWVSSLARSEILWLERRTGIELARLSLSAEQVDSVFRLVAIDGGLIAAPSFDTDRLHFIDARTGALDQAPFYAPLLLGPGRPIFDGLQIVAARPGRRGVDFTGPDLLALAGVASRITPVALREVLGP
ncbi:MAG: hypothetical protein IT384_00110 [Deltaproteobacteria bacterium]|nr:hypothetical protein [Deltaproteobacteria bacterium]